MKTGCFHNCAPFTHWHCHNIRSLFQDVPLGVTQDTSLTQHGRQQSSTAAWCTVCVPGDAIDSSCPKSPRSLAVTQEPLSWKQGTRSRSCSTQVTAGKSFQIQALPLERGNRALSVEVMPLSSTPLVNYGLSSEKWWPEEEWPKSWAAEPLHPFPAGCPQKKSICGSSK